MNRPVYEGYQWRYVAYALAHDNAPLEQLEHDKARWPGGCMVGFMEWIEQQWRAWRKARGVPAGQAIVLDSQHADFDSYLEEVVL
jgi:hypothetical protein